MSSSSKPVVLSLMRASGNLHLGNYLGALKNWIAMVDDYECFFGMADMHAITEKYTPSVLRKDTISILAQYIASGLVAEKNHFFLQSHVIGHAELAWVLGCITPLGQLERMTQFKEKAKKQRSNINAGLLYYPVLMASDILLYNADQVPVGEDQKQHAELCRDIAQKFNHNYSETFKVPEVYIPKTGARIMSLQDPENKMSKSDDNLNGTLFLLDPPDQLRKKIMSAVTDSGSEILAREDKPGMTNLLNILSSITNTSIAELENRFSGKGYAEFKDAVADAVIALVEPIQEKYATIINDKPYLESIIKEGANAAQNRANKMLSKVYRKVGFVERVR